MSAEERGGFKFKQEPVEKSLLSFSGQNREIIRIKSDCTVQLADGVTLDEVSELFWECVGKFAQNRITELTAELDRLRQENEQYRSALEQIALGQYTAQGCRDIANGAIRREKERGYK